MRFLATKGIKAKLKLIGLLPLITAVLFGLTFYSSRERLDALHDSAMLTEQMREELRELDALSRRIVETRANASRNHGYELLESLDKQMLALRSLGGRPDRVETLADMGRRLVANRIMRQLVTEVWADLTARQEERSVRFVCPALPSVPCDPRAIRQVWQNLLGNALKFTQGRDPAVIQVSAEREGDAVCYSVTDNGAGFDPAYSNKLFGLFLRLHGADEFEGTGVGLAIVKRFVEKHGGRAFGTGAVDAGATFSFSLPTRCSGRPRGQCHG